MSDKTPEEYLSLTPDDLLLEIGDQLTANRLDSKPIPDSEKRRLASRWYEAHLPEIRQRVCKEIKIQIGRRNKNRNELFKLLTDLLAAAQMGIPVGSIAALIINYGVEKLCSEIK